MSRRACRGGFETRPYKRGAPLRVKGARESEPLDSGTPPSPHARGRSEAGGSRSLSAPSTLAGDLLLYGVGARDRHLMGFAKDRSAQSTECVVDATSRMAA